MSHYLEFRVDVNALLPARVTMANILKAVVQHTGISSNDIRAHRNQRPFIHARQLYCYCARTMTSSSLPMIGKVINRDHTTVINSIAKFEDRLARDPELKVAIEDIAALAEQFAHADRGLFINDTGRGF